VEGVAHHGGEDGGVGEGLLVADLFVSPCLIHGLQPAVGGRRIDEQGYPPLGASGEEFFVDAAGCAGAAPGSAGEDFVEGQGACGRLAYVAVG
jgi:hypothetical protein